MTTNWKEMYSKIQLKAKIPAITKREYSDHSTIVRDMYIDLADLQKEFKQKECNPTMIYIFADVVRIPDNFVWDLHNNGLNVFARRIDVGHNANIALHFNELQSPEVMLFTSEITESLQITGVVNEKIIQTISLTECKTLGRVYFILDEKIVHSDLNTLDYLVNSNSSELQIILSAIFQYATILFYEEPDVAFSQLKWIKECTRSLATLDSIFCQASSLLVLLKISMSNVTYVPYLSSQIYTKSIKTFIEVARSYENEYTDFINLNRSLEERKKSANLILQHYQDTRDFSNFVLEQTKKNYEAVHDAVKSILADFTAQKSQVELEKVKFDFALDEWKRKKELEATVKILTGVLEFVGAISAMCVGDEAAAPAAEKSAQTVTQSAIGFGKLMKKISTLVELIRQLYTVSERILTASNSLAEIEDLKKTLKKETIDKFEPQDLTLSVEWDNFKEEVDTYLKMAIDAGISQATNYKLQLDKLIVYGKALAQNQIALVKVSQDLSKLLLKKEIEEKQVARISSYIQQMTDEQEENVDFMQIVYEQYLNIKRELFISIINYKWAYKYWALQDSQVKPVISDSISELNEALNNIQRDYQNALQSFNPPPQKFTNVSMSINDPELLAELKKSQQLSIPITLSNQIFQGFERVRVNTIRVWVIGVKAETQNLAVKITNSGNYQDVYNNQKFSFTTMTLQRLYEYELGTNKILVDGSIVDEERFAYFVPTPFSTWKIDLSTSSNQGMDLSQVEAVKIEFFGEMIPDMTYVCKES